MNGRLDIEMVNRGLIESREKAKALIMSGIVYINNQKAIKAGDKLSQIEIDVLLGKLKENIGIKCPHGRPVVIKITKM